MRFCLGMPLCCPGAGTGGRSAKGAPPANVPSPEADGAGSEHSRYMSQEEMLATKPLESSTNRTAGVDEMHEFMTELQGAGDGGSTRAADDDDALAEDLAQRPMRLGEVDALDGFGDVGRGP